MEPVVALLHQGAGGLCNCGDARIVLWFMPWGAGERKGLKGCCGSVAKTALCVAKLRRPRAVSMWQDVADFADTARRAYRRDVWATQDHLVKVWLEKDALSGIFEDILTDYGVTLNVGRGYDGWTSIRNAAQRYQDRMGRVTILHFGDFDPSGRDMVRSLAERIGFFETRPEMTICAILREDIDDYDLPPDFTKPTDSRQAAFVAEHGDIGVELDALPIEVLRDRIRDSVESHMDLDALAETKDQEADDQERIDELLRDA